MIIVFTLRLLLLHNLLLLVADLVHSLPLITENQQQNQQNTNALSPKSQPKQPNTMENDGNSPSMHANVTRKVTRKVAPKLPSKKVPPKVTAKVTAKVTPKVTAKVLSHSPTPDLSDLAGSALLSPISSCQMLDSAPAFPPAAPVCAAQNNLRVYAPVCTSNRSILAIGLFWPE